MKPRSIIVNNKQYLWRTFHPNGDGDGGIGVRIWENKKIITNLFFQWGRIREVTPKFVERIINNQLEPQEIGCAYEVNNAKSEVSE